MTKGTAGSVKTSYRGYYTNIPFGVYLSFMPWGVQVTNGADRRSGGIRRGRSRARAWRSWATCFFACGSARTSGQRLSQRFRGYLIGHGLDLVNYPLPAILGQQKSARSSACSRRMGGFSPLPVAATASSGTPQDLPRDRCRQVG